MATKNDIKEAKRELVSRIQKGIFTNSNALYAGVERPPSKARQKDEPDKKTFAGELIDKTVRKKPGDILTTMKMASEAAREFVSFIAKEPLKTNVRQYQRLVDAETKNADDAKDILVSRASPSFMSKPQEKLSDDADALLNKLTFVIIGASVSGLTFHATFVQEMRNHGLTAYLHLFDFQFVDLFSRPMERLSHARDRTIVPRFEYERLLSVTIDGEEVTDRFGKHLEAIDWDDPTYYEKIFLEYGSDNFTDCWEEAAPALPRELRWSGGEVRTVVRAILDGYKKIVGPHLTDKSIITHSGQVYQKHELKCSSGGHRSIELSLKTSNNREAATSSADDQKTNTIDCDGVIFARGPGIDIFGTPGRKGEVLKVNRRSFYEFDHVQRSYWDPIRPELDLLEPDNFEVLVMGHSDSAAGLAFSILLDDFRGCSFLALYDLLTREGEYESIRDWFTDLQQETLTGVQNLIETKPDKFGHVDWPKRIGELKTNHWQVGLLAARLHVAELPKVDTEESDLVAVPAFFNPAPVLENIERIFRTDRRLVFGLRSTGQLDDEKLRQLQAYFFSSAWPENQILMTLFADKYSVVLLKYGEAEESKFRLNRSNGYLKDFFKLHGNCHYIEVGAQWKKMVSKGARKDYKYVLAAVGGDQLNRTGNIARTGRNGYVADN